MKTLDSFEVERLAELATDFRDKWRTAQQARFTPPTKDRNFHSEYLMMRMARRRLFEFCDLMDGTIRQEQHG